MATAVLQPSGSTTRGMGPAGQALAERYWPLALSLARCYRRRYAGLDIDLDWEGEAGLVVSEVALRFEPRLEGSDFPATWFVRSLRRRLNGAFIDLMRASYPLGLRLRSRQGQEIPRVAQFPIDPDQFPRAAGAPVGHELEALETARALESLVTPPQRRVLDLLYREDLTDREAGVILHWSRSKVTRTHLEALSTIKDHLCVR